MDTQARHADEAQTLAVETDALELVESEAVPARLAAEAWEAGFAAARLGAAEERLERVIETLERPSLECDRQCRHLVEIAAALRQSLALVDVRSSQAGLAVAVDALFESGIVELPLRFAQLFQSAILASGW